MYQFVLNNKDFISIFISSIALLFSLYNFALSIYTRRKKVTLKFICYEKIQSPKNLNYTFKIIVENRSQLPISISSISLNDIYCENRSDYIFKIITHHKDQANEEKYYNIQLPINLSSLMSTSGFIRFATKSEFDFDNLSVNLYTNRGCIKNCKIYFDVDFKETDNII